MRKGIYILLFVGLAVMAGGWYWSASSTIAVTYKVATIGHGDLVSTISATGTLEPEEVVDVGAQVAGLIVSFGKDANGKLIDYRSPVEPNMVLARIDETVYKADVDSAQAQLEQSKTAVKKSQADLMQAKAKLRQAERNWNRVKDVGPSDALSQNDFDMYQADYESATATVAIVEAEISEAQNGISQAEGTLAKALRNLEFCTIKSPVKGTIIDRRVNIGQTVVSSLNAPSLFLIAQDLTRMQIWVAVNEADVGRIVAGTPVSFACDAFPDQTFEGHVGKVRLNATMTQNVVMYTAEVQAENQHNILLPYLTAKVTFQVQKEADVLMVPNAALRWQPTTAAQVSPAVRSSWKPTEPPSPNTARPAPKKQATTRPKERHGTVWIKDGEFVKPLDVKLGITDGLQTAVSGAGLQEGAEVIVSTVAQSAQSAQRNPFLPQVLRR